LICFFCLRNTAKFRIVDYHDERLGMRIRVYACEKCIKRIGDPS
jgi:hypothetical protein